MENYRLVIEHLKGDIQQRIKDIKDAYDELPEYSNLYQSGRKNSYEQVEKLIGLYEKDFVTKNK